MSKYEHLGRRVAAAVRQTTPLPITTEEAEQAAERWFTLLYELHGAMPDSWKQRLYRGLREGFLGATP